MMCVFTVVMTYSITCPIIVPFGRHRRAGTWALLGGTQDLSRSTLARQATRVDRAPAGRPSPRASRPVPVSVWGSARGEEGKSHLSSGWTELLCWAPGPSLPNTAMFAHTSAFTQVDILGHTSHAH